VTAWTSTEIVDAALGAGSGAAGDPYLEQCVAAANAWSYRKRADAGYTDDGADDAPAPSPDVGMGATLYAVALWRERASTDGFQSFGEIGAWSPTGGSLGQIKRLLGIPRAAVDRPPAELAPLLRRRRATRIRGRLV
jgi:hypothetical protein